VILGHKEHAEQRTVIYGISTALLEGTVGRKCRAQCNSIMDKKSEGKSIIFFGCLYGLWKWLHFCQTLTIGNLLEVTKYKIIVLKLSQLNKGI